MAHRLAELALSCIQMAEEARPTFAQLVMSLRSLEEVERESPKSSKALPFSQPRCSSPLSPQEVQPEPFELFALQCVKAQGVELQTERRIVHGLQVGLFIFTRLRRQECEGDVLPAAARKAPKGSETGLNGGQGPLSVGRAFQTALFEELVAKSVGRSNISREHFQAPKSYSFSHSKP